MRENSQYLGKNVMLNNMNLCACKVYNLILNIPIEYQSIKEKKAGKHSSYIEIDVLSKEDANSFNIYSINTTVINLIITFMVKITLYDIYI